MKRIDLAGTGSIDAYPCLAFRRDDIGTHATPHCLNRDALAVAVELQHALQDVHHRQNGADAFLRRES